MKKNISTRFKCYLLSLKENKGYLDLDIIFSSSYYAAAQAFIRYIKGHYKDTSYKFLHYKKFENKFYFKLLISDEFDEEIAEYEIKCYQGEPYKWLGLKPDIIV